MRWIKVTLPPFSWESDCPFALKILESFVIFEILFHVAAITKNLFYVANGLNLAHLSEAPKFYNGSIPHQMCSDHAFPLNILVSYLIYIN